MNILTSISNLHKNYLSEINFTNKTYKTCYQLIAIIASLYITFTKVVCFAILPQNPLSLFIEILIISAFFIFIYYIEITATILFKKYFTNKIITNSQKQKIYHEVFLLSTLIFFVFMYFSFTRFFPGGISEDNLNQWRQIQAFNFDNWHPVLHTLMIWLVSRIMNNYAFVVLVQILIFSLGLGYFFATLISWGFVKKPIFVIFFLLIINHTTRNIMLFLWKDSAFSICIMILMTMLVNIYLSDGSWLSSWKNISAFSALLVIATFVRHNAFFFTVPLLLGVLIMYRKHHKVKWIFPIVLFSYLLIRFPLYSMLNVTYPNNTLEESVGLPMTIMGDVFVKNPEALSGETKEFLLQFASEEEWNNDYRQGNYNSVKWRFSASKIIRETSPSSIIKMTLSTIKRDWRNSFFAVKQLTSFAWESNGKVLFNLNPYIQQGNEFDFKAQEGINELGEVLVGPLDLIDNIIPSTILQSIGFHVLCLIICFTVTFPKNGFKSFLFIIPILTYNFGTMLLLAGSDYRFFHFNLLITYPICLVLISSHKDESHIKMNGNAIASTNK